MKRSHTARVLFPVLFLVLAASCGGGGGGGGQVAATPVVAPSVAVTSPTVSGVTDEREVTVRGTAVPGSGAIADVRVNALSASTSDGFATWSVTVPLKSGDNAFAIVVEDDQGNATSVPFDVSLEQTSPILVDPRGVVADGAKGRLFVTDNARREVLSVDLGSGARKIVSGLEVGSGPLFETLTDIVFDEPNKRLFVLDVIFQSIFEVDLTTGNRRVVAATTTSDPLSLVGTTAMALGPGPDDLCTVSVLAGLLRVELSTGDIFGISDDEPALGPPLVSPRGLTVDAATGTAFVSDDGIDGVFAVDVATGKRTILSGNGVAAGPLFGFPAAVDVDPVLGLVVVEQLGALVAVDLGSGNRTTLSSASVGSGEPFSVMSDVAVFKDFAYVADPARNLLVRVDLVSGDRSNLGGTFVGSGRFLRNVPALERSSDEPLFATINDFGNDAIVAIDPRDGQRSDVSSTTVGLGEEFFGVRDVSNNPDSVVLLVVDDDDRLFGVNKETGFRIVLEDAATASDLSSIDRVIWTTFGLQAVLLDRVSESLLLLDLGNGFRDVLATGLIGAEDIAIDAVGERVIVVTGSALLAVDLATGVTEVVSSVDDPGASVDEYSSVAVDGKRGIAYVRDGELDKLLAIDLTTGARTLVADDFRGAGLDLEGDGSPTVSEDGETVFLFQSKAAAILAVTAATGDRVIVSR
jgi:hypothetical protein